MKNKDLGYLDNIIIKEPTLEKPHNYLTGSTGIGKTKSINEYLKHLTELENKKTIYVIEDTGAISSKYKDEIHKDSLIIDNKDDWKAIEINKMIESIKKQLRKEKDFLIIEKHPVGAEISHTYEETGVLNLPKDEDEYPVNYREYEKTVEKLTGKDASNETMRIVLIIDNFWLAKQLVPELEEKINELVKIGKGLDFSIIITTQTNDENELKEFKKSVDYKEKA